jgi:hypothetical protein
MKTIEQIEAEIAALQAELEAARRPDLGEAVERYKYGAEFPHSPYDNVHRGLIAAYPALHKALGPRVPEPTEAEDLAMAQEVVNRHWDDPRANDYGLAIAAIQSERKRAGGGK